ncbi:MAG TPA: AAA family ATPase, partial [Bacteroidia bacterium]|nr:AAA family ATPase [Bacteroidia bacterium]
MLKKIDMKFKKFIIENYQAIQKTEVLLNDNLIPIIGINESGKTTVLEAMLAFDSRKDKYKIDGKEGSHLDPSNRYEFTKNKKECFVRVEVVFESEKEVNEIADGMVPKMEHTSSLKAELLTFITNTNGKSLTISRRIDVDKEQRKYTVEGLTNATEINEKLAEEIVAHTPPILYFDDNHLKDVENTITFPASYLTGTWSPGKSTYIGQWQSLLEQICNDATQHTLIELIQSTNERDNLLMSIQGLLKREIITEWENLKNKKQGLSADGENEKLDLSIKYNHVPSDEKTAHQFTFKVIDNSITDAPKGFDVFDRSKGFKWFFNFIFKLKYNSDYLEEKSHAIFLLDEPGSFLHSSAQEGLLGKLKASSEQNQIVFCTHSQYFLNPTIINISHVKVVSKENEHITVHNFDETGVSKYTGAWDPLFHALHLNTGFQIFEGSKLVLGTLNAIITEGTTDFYFFDMLKRHTSLITVNNIKFIPGSGASQLRELISICIASADKYLVLLDNDKAGRTAYDKYNKDFGDEESKNFFLYPSLAPATDFDLENFLSVEDVKKLKDITGCQDEKHAIITLYHRKDETEQKNFFTELNTATQTNLALVVKRINE